MSCIPIRGGVQTVEGEMGDESDRPLISHGSIGYLVYQSGWSPVSRINDPSSSSPFPHAILAAINICPIQTHTVPFAQNQNKFTLRIHFIALIVHLGQVTLFVG
jgi:hypothetical protein